jgi:cell division protein FtsN
MAKRRKKSESDLGARFAWMLFGLSIGLVVAAAVYLADRPEPPAETTAATPPPAPTPPEAPETEVVEIPAQAQTDVEPHPASRFDFFDILPTFEVVLPDVEPAARRAPESIEAPGTYALQAGSFTDPIDAERRKANVALLGIASTLQRAEIGGITYHRVIIGPTTDQDELNRTRRRLWEADIDVFLYRISD